MRLPLRVQLRQVKPRRWAFADDEGETGLFSNRGAMARNWWRSRAAAVRDADAIDIVVDAEGWAFDVFVERREARRAAAAEKR